MRDSFIDSINQIEYLNEKESKLLCTKLIKMLAALSQCINECCSVKTNGEIDDRFVSLLGSKKNS